MRSPILQRAEIWRIPAASRGFLPISRTTGPDGTVLDVSTYESMIWDFSPYIPTVNVNWLDSSIRFTAPLPSGARLSAPEHAGLLASAKAFIYVRWMFPAAKSGKYLKARTIIGEWRSLAYLLDWMILNGIRAFKDITPDLARAFLDAQIARRDQNGLAKRNGLRAATLVETLYHCRSHLADAPQQHPWPDSGVLIEYGIRRADRAIDGAATEIIPRRLLVKLGSFAQTCIAQRGPRILEIWRATWAEIASVVDDFRREERLQLDLRWGRVKRKTFPQSVSALEKQFSDRIQAVARSHGYADAEAFLADVALLSTACYVVCGIFSGMRDSELTSLRPDSFKRTIEPDGEEYCWLLAPM